MKKPIVMLAFALGLVGLYFFFARRASAAAVDSGAASGVPAGATGAVGALPSELSMPAGGSGGLPSGGIAFEGGMPASNPKAPVAAPTAAPAAAPSGGSAPPAIGAPSSGQRATVRKGDGRRQLV